MYMVNLAASWLLRMSTSPIRLSEICNTLQHTATHCNTLPHTAIHCNTLQHTATHCSTLQHTLQRRADCRKRQTILTSSTVSLSHSFTHSPSLSLTHTHTRTLSLSLSLALALFLSRLRSLSISISYSFSLGLSFPPTRTQSNTFVKRGKGVRLHYHIEGGLIIGKDYSSCRVCKCQIRGAGGAECCQITIPTVASSLAIQHRNRRVSCMGSKIECKIDTHARLLKVTHAKLTRDSRERLTCDL